MSQYTETVTHAYARDVRFPDHGGTLVLVTIDNGFDHTRPTTFGPAGIAELEATLAAVRDRVLAGEVAAVAVTGKPYVFAAGADLKQVTGAADRTAALELARAGHRAFSLLADLPVPTFAFVNGVALGGGFELALAAGHRTVSADVRALGLPETGLGLVPGWGGAYRVPRLIGVAAALDVILTRPAQNRPLTAAQAAELGLVDVVLDPADFLEQSIRWAAAVVRGDIEVPRRRLDDEPVWAGAVASARTALDETVHGSRPAPYRALDLIAAARTASESQAFAAEDDALADLIMSDEMRASVYAFSLVGAAKRPSGAPDRSLAAPVTRAGVVGAGLMAAQIAVLLAQRLEVPVVLRDLDADRVAAGLAAVRAQVDAQVTRGRLSPQAAARVVARITGSTELSVFAGCDLVIEAVTELLEVKKRVFAELEQVVAPGTVLATNTSALSVTAMAAHLQHPERVVGLHFFNPVAAMPLVEVVQAATTSAHALATAFEVAARLRKTAVLVSDRPGFVVNRLLVLLLGIVVDTIDRGTPVEVADRALDPLGLPMPPFELFDLVGPAVGLHVLETLNADLGPRFPVSPGLAKLVADHVPVVQASRGKGLPRRADPAIQAVFDEHPEAQQAALDEEGVRDAVLQALTAEIGRMLDEGVVASPQQIDLCMILGAGWGFHLGGICPYLDRTGWSLRVLGHRLLAPGLADIQPAA
ncbi:MAG: enoyl-CoA hydratase/isomerase family protein [Actinobacteria bacterium]|nr:enoyl-CoA hydratase/isomerase family protein [Actinomycetota bacterium]